MSVQVGGSRLPPPPPTLPPHVQETERLMKDPIEGISAAPNADNLRYFNVMIEGPPGTAFEGERGRGRGVGRRPAGAL